MFRRIIIRKKPAWLVDESEPDSGRRRRSAEADSSSGPQRHPGDFGGQVLATLTMDQVPGSKDLADPSRVAVVMDVTEEELAGLRAGTMKIARGRVVPISFEDTWGALEGCLAERGFDRADVTAIAAGLADASRAEDFRRVHTECLRALPAPVVHTGAGLYLIGPGKPYLTYTSALAQGWADQGSAQFTNTQEFRGHAGTFAETITVPSGFRPQIGQGFDLVVSGDPADSPDNIILQGAGGGSVLVSTGPDHIEIRHLTIGDQFTSVGVSLSTYDARAVIADVKFKQPALNKISLLCTLAAEVRDCLFDCPAVTSYVIRFQAGFNTLLRTHVISGGTGVLSLVGAGDTGGGIDVQACRFQTAGRALFIQARSARIRILNSGFFGCSAVLLMDSSLGARIEIVNCAAKDTAPTGHILELPQNPERTSLHTGPELVLKRNYWDGVDEVGAAGFATCNVIAKTHAEILAFNQVDHEGDVLNVDPEWTDPANGDFSTAEGSPLRGAGIGSLVPTDYLATAFDPETPDVGPWSSGLLPTAVVDRPSITSATDDETGTSATLVLAAVDPADELAVWYRKRNYYPWTVFPTPRTGSGTLQVTDLELASYVFQCIASRGGVTSLPSDTKASLVSDGVVDVEVMFRDLVLADATVKALLGIRYYASAAPQPPRLPYVVAMKVSDVPFHSLARAEGKSVARIQLDMFAATYEETRALAEAIRLAVDGYDSQTVHGSDELEVRAEDERDGAQERSPGAALGFFWRMQDYLVTHNTSLA